MKLSATSVLRIISLILLPPSSQAQESSTLCLCSPRKYSLTLSLSQTCETDTLANSPGIWTTICSIDSNFGAETEFTELIPSIGESLVRRVQRKPINGGDRENVLRAATDVMVPVKIISVVFAEIRSDGSLVIMNKDEKLADVDLNDGAVMEFDSISQELDPKVDINDQISSVPGGVTILLVGENSMGELVKTRILWLYDNNCDAMPLAGKTNLGWISVDAGELASDKFCPLKSTLSSRGTLFAKSGKVGKSTETTSSPSTPLSTKTGKIGKSPTTEVNMALHSLFSKAGKFSSVDNLLSKSNKSSFIMEGTKEFHSDSPTYDESHGQYPIESKSGKAVATNSNSKSQKK